MELKIKHREEQHAVAIFGGRLHENKPLAGDALYSNLIYWAHVEAPEEGTFPMHPHKGIEILTFVFEGGLEHFDTATNVWTPLPEGGVQLIQAGKGVQHSEKYIKGSRAFQIWFDPDFSKALKKDAYYKDFQANAFHWEKEDDKEVMRYAGEGAPIQTDAIGISATRYKLNGGLHNMELEKDSFYSIYIMNGNARLKEKQLMKDSFARVTDAESIEIESVGETEIFILKSPVHIPYDRVIDK